MNTKNRESESNTNLKERTGENHYIVGIGASAGGLESINELFDNIPSGSDFSYIIIQHLSPDYKSLMDELLAKHTQMEIFVAEQNMKVQPNCVYLIPSKKNLAIKNGKLYLVDKPSPSAPNHAIDVFFESLAKEKGTKAIGIILSGTGTDGTKGIEAIKNNGGMVIVQDPTTAKFDGMPNSAIYSGYSDFILPPELMSETFLKYPNEKNIKASGSNVRFNNGEDWLMKILNHVKEQTTHDFTAYKRQTLERRVSKRMATLTINDSVEYLHYLKNNPDEVDTLCKEFLIGVTKFFRDPLAFEVIRKKVIPGIIEGKSGHDQVKIWVAACSTGEEAYSIAMLVCEYLEKVGKDLNVKIFATDMDPRAVEFAAKGIYPQGIEEDISSERLEKFFAIEDQKYCISPKIRKMVIFAQHNLIKDPPFSNMDMVSCRNMLIYIESELQKKVLSAFHFALKRGGYLILGSSENNGPIKNALTTINKKWNIYKTVTVNKNYAFADSQYNSSKKSSGSSRALDLRPSANTLQKNLQVIFSESIIEEVGYAAVFINENYDLLHAVGDYKKFLRLPDKKLQLNLLKMVPKELSMALSVGLRKAVRTNEKITSKKVKVTGTKKSRLVNLVIKPYLSQDQYNQKFIFVLFKQESITKPSNKAEENYDGLVSLDRLSELEAELNETKENLQTMLEELETSNEELQSSNEELISSNEELQSTNEELQSLNEELHTVNTEHQLKIKELIELNDDLDNYFRSTDIGQLFVDKNLKIRKYTPSVVKHINIIESDIGRPVDHFSYNIKGNNLVADIKDVIAHKKTIEKEVEVGRNQYFQMRILPYIRQDKTIDGVVITFVNITELKQLNGLLSGILHSSQNGIMALECILSGEKVIDFKWAIANRSALKLLHRNQEDLNGKRLLEVLPGIKKAGLFDQFVHVYKTGEVFHKEHHYTDDGIKSWFEITAVQIDNGIAVTFADISVQKEADEELLGAYDDVQKAKEKLRKHYMMEADAK